MKRPDLSEAFPERYSQPLEGLFRLFEARGRQLYLVGGCVRDMLLNLDTSDFDMATDAKPEETSSILQEGGYPVIPLGMEFGTVGTLLKEKIPIEVQITTFRTGESYSRGSRHPDVMFGSDLVEDLKRRDFTVNCMAMDSNGRILDPLNGMEDIQAGILRTPLDPCDTFAEDPLRMLRAFRFACRLKFRIDQDALQAVDENHMLIRTISRERWKMEMDQLLEVNDGAAVARTLEDMKRCGLLQDMVPELKPVFQQTNLQQGPAHFGNIWQHTMKVIEGTPPDRCLRWAALLHDIGKPQCRSVDDEGTPHFYGHQNSGADLAGRVADSFRFSKKEKKCVVFLVQNHMRPVLYSSDWSDRAVRKLAREAGEHLRQLLLLARADIDAHSEPYASQGAERMNELEERLLKLLPSEGERVLPRELGAILHGMVGSELESASQVGVILENLRELIHDGKLEKMQSPEYYLGNIRIGPDLKQSSEDLT
ncbi:MAG: HD domain-containing protein [Candidatus Aegiribacteria sp.]|nr:HD domain-containing protein [Candidatus Aegiribacteria sp.]MBD3294967.1 HD domain-containing protein [Candidatus Fermentibacteria bacterium]